MSGRMRGFPACNRFLEKLLSHWRPRRQESPVASGMLGPGIAYNIAKGKP
jgi:hypothetical protein